MAHTPKAPRITLDPNASPEDRAAYWQSLTKRERMAMLRSGNVLTVSSATAQDARHTAREWAKNV